VAFVLVFVAMAGGDGGGKICSEKEFTAEQRKTTEAIILARNGTQKNKQE
jgi:hypothetical protein